MSLTVGVYEAKTHLPELLDRVARGDIVTITKRGVPIAQIGPPSGPDKPDPVDVINDLIAYSKAQKRTLGATTIRELVEAGRRF